MKFRADRSATASLEETPLFPGSGGGMLWRKGFPAGSPHVPGHAPAGLAAAVSLFAAMALPSGEALADNPTEFFGHVNPSFHDGSACSTKFRVPSNVETQCANMGWTNKTGGTFHYAKNECIQYGDLVVTVNQKKFIDGHYHLDNSTKKYTTVIVTNVRDMNCCADRSDLCLRQEVEASDAGFISRWTGEGLTYADHDVSTHEKRYKHCQDYSDSIYCEVDPSGDAFTAPRCTEDITIEGITPCEDLVTAHQCADKFAKSGALQTGIYNFRLGNLKCAFSTGDWDDYNASTDLDQCVIETRCPTGSVTYVRDGAILDPPEVEYVENTITDSLLYIGTYVNCSGTLEKLRCSQ